MDLAVAPNYEEFLWWLDKFTKNTYPLAVNIRYTSEERRLLEWLRPGRTVYVINRDRVRTELLREIDSRSSMCRIVDQET